MGGFRKGGSCNNRFVLKPDVAIASEVSTLGKSSLAITDFLVKKTQLVNYCENQRRRDDNEIKLSLLRGGSLGAERKILVKCCFSWETPRQ